jgi:hypothetical protein
VKKTTAAAQRHKTALIFYALALVIILLSIPWPGTPAGRPLFRGLDSDVSALRVPELQSSYVLEFL